VRAWLATWFEMDQNNQRCVKYPRNGKPVPEVKTKKINQDPVWIVEPEKDYVCSPVHPEQQLPKVQWRDAVDYLEDCNSNSKLPLCVWLGK